MTTPTVTAAIAFYNNASTLREAILSVVNQTYADWELLLVDDGSTDGSRAVAEAFAGPRVRILGDGRNRGHVARLNEIASAARGTFLARMDGDDIMHPRRLEVQVQYLLDHPEVDLVDSAMISIDERGQIVGERGRAPQSFTLAGVLHGQAPNHATVLARTAWFRAHPYDPGYLRVEDRELWCRTVGSSVFAHIQEPLYFVREGQINVRGYAVQMASVRRVNARYGRAVLRVDDYWRVQAATYAKEWIYQLAGALGWQGRLTARRNQPMALRDREEAERMLRAATCEPGAGTPRA